MPISKDLPTFTVFEKSVIGLDDRCGVMGRKVRETCELSMVRQTFCITVRAVDHHWRSVINANSPTV